MKRFILALFLLCPITSWAQDSLFEPLPKQFDVLAIPTMHFTLLTQKGKNILVMWGGINEGDAQRFREALEAAKPTEIWLTSRGGNAYEGIEIARIIRAQKVTTRVKSGTSCISACNYIFLGGTVRFVETGARFEAHMFANQERSKIMRLRVLLPPDNLLKFLHMYPDHEIFAIEDFMRHVNILDKAHAVQLVADKKELPADLAEPTALLEAMAEFAAFHNGVPLTCPGAKIIFGPNGEIKDKPQEAQAPVQTRAEKTEPLKENGAQQNDPQKEDKPQEIVDIPDNPCAEEFLRTYLRRETAAEEVKAIEQGSAQLSATMARFLTEMSVSLRYMTEYGNIHNDKPRALTQEELRSLNIVNAD